MNRRHSPHHDRTTIILRNPTRRHSQSCPMQDDPERGECFQHKMILKRRQRGEGTLRVNASHHGACSTSHAGRDARIRGLQRQPHLYGAERREIYGLVERTLQAHEYLRLDSRLSCRQRRGVSQPWGGQAAEQAADRGVHQVAGASHDRQCPGPGQEWGGRAQAHRPPADPRRARGGVPALLHGLFQPLFELSPPRWVGQRGGERARQVTAPLSARGLPHALGKAGLARPPGAALEERHQRRHARTTSTADERYGMLPPHAATQAQAAGPVPLPLVNPSTSGRGPAAPDSAGMAGMAGMAGAGGSSPNVRDPGH